MDFTITSQQIVWICGFIASVWGVVKIIKDLFDHDGRLDEDKERSNLLLKANIAILNGLLSDSDKEKLVETRNEIQDFLVEKN